MDTPAKIPMKDFAAPISGQIWDMKYRFKHPDGLPIDMDVEDTWMRIANDLARPEEDPTAYAPAFLNALRDFQFLPAGRITAGAGTGRAVTLFNCFVMGTIPDSMDGIFSMLREAALTMQQGGGIGYDFSPIRPKTSRVKKLGADASGPLSFMNCWDAMCRTVMSAGSRRGAMMATMRCDHPDIEDFITAKQDSARLRMFNLSVLVTDAFMEAVKADGEWELVHKEPPANAETEGRKRKGEVVWVHRTVNARDLWKSIMESTYKAAEPGVIFIDRINEANNLRYVEQIAATNPCGEQPLPPYGACLLGSINLSRLVMNPFDEHASGLDGPQLEKLVATAVRMMDNVIEVSNFPLEQQREEAFNKRRIGLGVTGLADALAMCCLRYGTEEAAERTESWMQLIAHAAYKASIELAQEKGAFPLFDAEEFLAPGTHASTMPDYIQESIRRYGIRNALLTSIAPTGTISLYAGNVSSGIEPIFALSYKRKVLQPDGSRTEELVEDYAVAKYREHWEGLEGDEFFDLKTDLPDYFVTAQDLTPEEHLRIQVAAQKWVDSSISKTINCPEDISFEDFQKVYEMAYEWGCKGCTTYRPNEITGSVLTVEEEPKEERRWDDLAAFLVAVQDTHDQNVREDVKHAGQAARQHWFACLEHFGVGGAKDVPAESRQKFLDYMSSTGSDSAEMPSDMNPVPNWVVELPFVMNTVPDSVEVKANAHEWEPEAAREIYASEALPKRPEELEGSTYKIKVGDLKAVYLTINDMVESDGTVRPFEIFLRSSDPQHDEWMVALARMVSAIMRRPYDASFIGPELMRIASPVTGGFQPGAGYQPSLVAAIGRKLKEHAERTKATLQSVLAEPMTAAPDWSSTTGVVWPHEANQCSSGALTPKQARLKAEADMAALRAQEAMVENVTGEPMTLEKPKGPSCPKCHGYNVKVENGCPTCLDCGHSKCG